MTDTDTIIERAIKSEEESSAFYLDLARIVEDPNARDTLLFLAEEEKTHREYLLRYRQGGFAGETPKAVDYRIAEHLTKPDIDKDIRTKDVYLVAANREINAHHFYRGLAELHPDGEVRRMLMRMADEELRHKEKMEYLYANTAFPQTAGG